MSTIIKIKNKTNWLLTIILGLGLLILSFIILIIIPLSSLQEESSFFILHYISFTAPFTVFFILFLYIWLWNTFGKTVLTIDPETIKIEYKNKLFASPKTYLKKDINQIEIKDFQVER